MVSSSLHHYTTLEGFTYIISSKNIRFSRLDKVNDVDEGLSSDYNEANTMVFVSCWTDCEQEQLELWSLYTHLKGVRISFPPSIFLAKSDHLDGRNFSTIIWDELSKEQQNQLMLERKSAVHGIGQDSIQKVTHAITELWGPEKVRYVRPDALPVRIFDDTSGNYDVMELGLRKREHWAFEKGSRFRLIGLLHIARRVLIKEYGNGRKTAQGKTSNLILIYSSLRDLRNFQLHPSIYTYHYRIMRSSTWKSQWGLLPKVRIRYLSRRFVSSI